MTADLKKFQNDPNYVIEFAIGPPLPALVAQNPKDPKNLRFQGKYFNEPKRYIMKKAHMSKDDTRIFDMANGRLCMNTHHPGKNPYEMMDPLGLTNQGDRYSRMTLGEWESVCDVTARNGFHSFKIRPKKMSRHGRQYIKDWNNKIIMNVGKESKFKTMSIRNSFVVYAGEQQDDISYEIAMDMMGRTIEIKNAAGQQVCVVAKTPKALIMNAALGAGSESTIDIAPGADCSTMLAIVIGLKQAGEHFVKDAFGNFVADPLKDAAIDGAVDATGTGAIVHTYKQVSNNATHKTAHLTRAGRFVYNNFFKLLKALNGIRGPMVRPEAQQNGGDHSKVNVDLESGASNGLSSTPAAEVRRMVILSLAVCTFYITVSSSMVFTNKALSFTYGFRTTNILLFIQMLFTIAFLRFLRDVLCLISFDDFHLSNARQVAPVSIFYSLNAAFALIALRELSVPSYTLIKRLAPCFCIALEFILLHKRPARLIIISLAIMSLGTVLAARSDVKSTTSAWMLGFGSCIFQATYLTYVKRSGRDTGMSSTGILYYHSIMSLPCLAVIILAVGEIGPAMRYQHWTSPPFLIVLIMSLFMGLLLNYALFLCTEKTSPTSTTVSGQVKAMGQTLVGMFTFGGVDMNQRYLMGTLMNIAGGVGYAYSKYKSITEHGHG